MPLSGSVSRQAASGDAAAARGGSSGGLLAPERAAAAVEPFAALPPSGFLSMAPVPVISAGVRLFQEGWGGRLCCPRPGRLEAADGGVETVIWVDGGRLRSTCTCPESSRIGHCRHVCALFAGTMALLHGRLPGGARPNARALRNFQRAFAPEEEGAAAAGAEAAGRPQAAAAGGLAAGSGAVPALAENRLELVCESGYFIRWRGVIPRMVWDALGPFGKLRTFSCLPLQPSWMFEVVHALLSAGAAFGIPMYFRRENRVSPPLFSERRSGAWRLVASCGSGGGVDLGFGLELDGVCPAPFVDDLGGAGAVLHSGELVATPDGPDETLMHDLAAHQSWAGAGCATVRNVRWEASVAPEVFNARSLAACLARRESRRGSAAGFLPLQDGKPIEMGALPALESEGRLVFDISPGASGEGGCAVELAADFGGFRVSLEPACRVVAGHFYREGREPRLTCSAARMSGLLEIAGRLHGLDRREEARALVKAALDEDGVFPRSLRFICRRILEEYHRFYAAPEEPVCRFPVVTPEGGWAVARLGVPAVARAVVALPGMARVWGSGPGGAARGLAGADCSAREVAARLAPLAKSLGGVVSFGGRPVAVRRLDIRVEVRRGGADEEDEIDWFELRPEVACGSLTIPQEEWEQLLLGGVLETPDGGIVLPDQESFETLRRVASLRPSQAGRPGRSDGGRENPDRAHALEVVEWLELRKLGVRVNIPDEIAIIIESLASFERLPETPLPKGFQARLRPYQKRGYDWLAFLYTHRLGACLADDMGLGKTLQAIAFLSGIQEQVIPPVRDSYLRRPHLVIVPPSLLFNWQSEFRRFSPALRVAEYAGAGRDLGRARGADVVLTTYDVMRLDIEKLAEEPFHAVVFDEAQLLKNHESARARAARRLRRAFAVCLSGTPVENHAGEYHSILSLALPGLLGDYNEFVRAARTDPAGAVARTRPVVLRRTKEEILKELPPKTEQDIGLEMTTEQRECYTRMVAEIREEVARAYNVQPAQQAGIVALTCLMRLRQICVSPALLGRAVNEPPPKLAYLIEKLRELHDQGHSALVFSQFTGALDLACAEAGRAGLHHLRLDGSTPPAKRKALVEKFQTSCGPLCFFISLRSGGTGLNLTRASYVFHLDPWWNPAVENQASDRAHRIGQKNPVLVQRLIMRGSVEEKMMILKERKRRIFEQIVCGGPGRGGGGLITAEDVRFLLG